MNSAKNPRMVTGLHGVTAMAVRMAATVLLAALALSASAQTVRYIHTDSLGSVAVVTDQNRNVLERREYEPYGFQLTPAIKDGPGYTGHVQDAATGLTYMQQRYYDPQIGRFLSVDPVGVSAVIGLNFNRYWYASNNPYTNTDPDGRCDGPSTCAIDRDIAAMNRRDISRDEFMDRSEARAAGAIAGLALWRSPATARSIFAALFGKKVLLSPEAQRGIRSLEKRIKEHIEKLERFKENPTVRPGMEKLPKEAIEKQQRRRIEHLEKEIKTFRENIEKLRNPPPPPPPPSSRPTGS